VLGGASFVAFIPVTDLARARALYEGLLGVPVTAETPFAMVLDAAGTTVRLTPVADFAVRPFTVAGWNVPDIDTVLEALGQRGVTCTRFEGMDQDDAGVWTAPGGARVAWFRDPDGNTLSVTQPGV
jgi:catechol 2,3-dioxygenase-like lactoylglutathione lyase family enzyme